MKNKTFKRAAGKIAAYFDSQLEQAFSYKKLADIYDNQFFSWNLPPALSKDFAGYLEQASILKAIPLLITGAHNEEEKIIYAKPLAQAIDIACALYPKAYLSHFTALFLNNLTEQLPKVVYVTNEQSRKPQGGRIESQEAIDAAFGKTQRISQKETEYNGTRIIILNGKHTGRYGILENAGLSYTNIYRTLIDAVVRPSYSGGIQSVLDAFTEARQRQDFSVNQFIATYKKLDFIYPYNQAIGFYMERAGFPEKALQSFRYGLEYDFYLTYGVMQKGYSKEWRLYYPMGM